MVRLCSQPLHQMLGRTARMVHQRGYGQVLLSATAPDAGKNSTDGASKRLWSGFAAISHCTRCWEEQHGWCIREAMVRLCSQPLHQMLGRTAWMVHQRGCGQALLSATAPDARKNSMAVAPKRIWSGFAINQCTGF